MEAASSSEMSLDFQRTTRRYIPEDSTLHNHRCAYLKSYKIMGYFVGGYKSSGGTWRKLQGRSEDGGSGFRRNFGYHL
jgi:hypothetical protein